MDCHLINLKRTFNKIVEKKSRMPEEVKESYETLEKIVDDMIEELSILREKIW